MQPKTDRPGLLPADGLFAQGFLLLGPLQKGKPLGTPPRLRLGPVHHEDHQDAAGGDV